MRFKCIKKKFYTYVLNKGANIKYISFRQRVRCNYFIAFCPQLIIIETTSIHREHISLVSGVILVVMLNLNVR